MPIIDKTGKKKKFAYTVNGHLMIRGSWAFESVIVAENEDEARELAEEEAIDDLRDNASFSDFIDETEFDDVEQGDEIIPEPERILTAPALSFATNFDVTFQAPPERVPEDWLNTYTALLDSQARLASIQPVTSILTSGNNAGVRGTGGGGGLTATEVSIASQSPDLPFYN